MVEPRGFIDTSSAVKFLQQLAGQEKSAQLKGRGIWYGTDHMSSWNRAVQWMNTKVGRSTEDQNLMDTSLPISTVAKDMSNTHR